MSQLFAWGGQSTGFSFSISPSSERPGLISFRMDWLDLASYKIFFLNYRIIEESLFNRDYDNHNSNNLLNLIQVSVVDQCYCLLQIDTS